jgi:secreted trypsin-like serine protease
MKEKAWMSLVVLFVCSLPLRAYAFDRGSSVSHYILHGVTVGASDPIAASTVAIINQSENGTSLCTGSLIADDLVVTAGHCVSGKGAELSIEFTTNLSRSKGKRVRAMGIARPKSYGHMVEEEDMNDIALIHFEGGLPEPYHKARLLEDASLLKDGEKVILAGYGVNDGTPHQPADEAGAGVLRKVSVRIARASYGHTEVAMDPSHGRGACHGDSGGPAFIKQGNEYLLFGVTSRGFSEGPDDCTNGSIYTNILAQAKFVSEAAVNLRQHR